MIEQLITHPELNAREKMVRFIEEARHGCAAFGQDLDWMAPAWNVKSTCPKPVGKAGQSAMLYFTTHENGTAKTVGEREALEEPFASFIKALVRRKQENRLQSVDPLARIINAARDLHTLLVDRNHDPVRLNHADFTAAARMVVGRAAKTTAYRLGCALQEIADTIDRHQLTITRINWQNPLQRQTNSMSRISPDANEARENKLPDKAVLDEIARLSHLVTEPSDVILMSHITLMQCAPWRDGELLALADDCEVEEQKIGPDGPIFDEHGVAVMRYGLRYWKGKSTDAAIKWIPTVMVDVAKRAVTQIKRHTDDARRLARWLEEHPGRAWLPGPDEGTDQAFSKAEVAEMFGMQDAKAGRQWLMGRGLLIVGTKNFQVRRADLEAVLLAEMITVEKDRRDLKLSQHLFLTFKHLHTDAKATNPCLLSMTRDQHISDFLAGRKSDRGRTLSVFEKFGSPPLPDGSPMRMNSHQFRHWLNTLAQTGGLDQALIARWSGRDDVGQNGEYDHLTGTELAERFQRLMEDGKVLGALGDVHQRKEPKDRSRFREAVFATAHITDIGICDLDWSSSTCPDFKACETCEFNLVVKGDDAARDRTQQRRDDQAWLLERTEVEIDDGTLGASNHAEALKASISGCDRILKIHADGAIPDGTLVQPSSTSPEHFTGRRLEDAA